jgi:hypothetical protein
MTMQEFKLEVPTYNGNRFAQEVERGEKPEFGKPQMPVLIRVTNGVRVVFGTHQYEGTRSADILIERQPSRWVIFLHPLGDGDPIGSIAFLDDGRSFLIKEVDPGSAPLIQVTECDEDVPEIAG